MSFFDKFFSHKNKNNKNEIEVNTGVQLSRSSNLTFSKDQIRFVLFRECDRRGRKLLFDSNTVEKQPLPSRGITHDKNCQQPNNEKIIDFIETTNTHGYKYKKPSNDVASLGEMIFGSVAMIYKGGNSCKIHSIPSPKQVMFTTIVHAPSRCPFSITSECSLKGSSMQSSLTSFNDNINEKQTSSSDSRLYKKQGVTQKCSSTYPWIKNSSPYNKIIQCCESSDLNSSPSKTSLHKSNSNIQCLESLCLNDRDSETNLFSSREEGKANSEKLQIEGELPNNWDNFFVMPNSLNESENVSSVSGSLSSLRRRWNQSYSTSLDSTAYEDTSTSSFKKRTKLGMALVLDLRDTMENEVEKFLYNHTIIIDCIMNKLQSSVELAYIKNENFVDLIYTAFWECQQSIYDLITCEKFTNPMWISLIGNSEDNSSSLILEKNEDFFKNQDSLKILRLKFLNDFYDILVKFDTKDTNFFISTLLTAVLTHHLSWVTAIAETDIFTKQQKLQSVIKKLQPYNALWAQLNDLCGLLGTPLKCARTIISGSENKKSQIAAIIQVLTYFIRCYNVVENIYDVDIGEIVENADLKRKNSDCGEGYFSEIDSDLNTSCLNRDKFLQKPKNTRLCVCVSDTDKSSDEEQESIKTTNKKIHSRNDNNMGNSAKLFSGLKRSESVLSNLKLENTKNADKLYPDLKDLAKRENVSVEDLDLCNNSKICVDKFLSNEKLTEKIQRMIRVPKKNMDVEGYLSPDEGYDTIDSTKTEHHYPKKVFLERQCSTPAERKEGVMFLLGENEELVKSPKKVVMTKSSKIDFERENSSDIVIDLDHISSERTCSPNLQNSENIIEKEIRTLKNCCNVSDRTLLSCCKEKNNKHSLSQNNCKNACKLPWLVRELEMLKAPEPCKVQRLDVSSVLGGVNEHYNSEQVVQGIVDPKNNWEDSLKRDLFLCAHNSILEKEVNEAVCILADVNSWEVSVCSSSSSILDRKKHLGVRVGMSQLVAEMLESFVYIHKINLSPDFCFLHIERKLHEIYLKSKAVAELLNSTESCSIDYLIKKLDIEINDIPLLLSVATTHSPQISQKYGLSFTWNHQIFEKKTSSTTLS